MVFDKVHEVSLKLDGLECVYIDTDGIVCADGKCDEIVHLEILVSKIDYIFICSKHKKRWIESEGYTEI